MRIDKLLCDLGYGTRKQVKEQIKNGMVSVNGEVVLKPEFHVDENKDLLMFNGKEISFSKYHYFMLNKPQGVLSSREKGPTPTVIDLLADENCKNLSPVGRLDKDTEGLLLITDDGKLSHNLLSPKKHVDKTYEVHLKNTITEEDIKKLEDGIDIGDDKKTLPAKCILSDDDENGYPVILLTIHEGRFHQVKRMLEAVENEVVFLRRLSMGSLQLDEDLEPGEYRELTKVELDNLLNTQQDV
ncbi:MAG: rRNA pseudouridine synthase [Butyrivibrio sp.]|nr:rRNA pseudouridine synthase [Butyrivibrio sp.]